MFLFPWLDWGNDISDFEKIDFLGSWAIFGLFSPLQEQFLTVGTFSQLGLESPRRKILKHFFFGNFQKTSKCSKNIFWASSDHIVAQKLIFWKKKSSKKSLAQVPPFSYMRDIVFILQASFDSLQVANKMKNYRKKRYFLAIFWPLRE